MSTTEVAHVLWVLVGVAGLLIGLWMTGKDLNGEGPCPVGEVSKYSKFVTAWGLLWIVLGVLGLVL